MGRMQLVAIGLAVWLNALDGFDVLSISFAAPGIAAQWGVDRGALGIVLLMELLGMAIGSLALGNASDRYGRRPVTLVCVSLMTVGMLLVAGASGIAELSAWRVLTGVGIGGMLATTNAIVAEFANDRRRSFCIALMAAGYPAGAALGGIGVAALLEHHGWTGIFRLGGALSAASAVAAAVFLPETAAWLVQKQPAGALRRLNRLLASSGHAPVATLPRVAAGRPSRLGALFAAGMAATTLFLATIYFGQMISFYFILKWVPKIVVDMGFSPSAAGRVLVWANVGGVAGSVVLGWLALRVDLARLTAGAMLLAMAGVAAFGWSRPSLPELAALAFLACLFGNGAMVGLYALVARAFPTELRASGTGLVIGVGRGGAALSPIIAGTLFQHGSSLPLTSAVMAIGTGLGGTLLLVATSLPVLRRRAGEPAPS